MPTRSLFRGLAAAVFAQTLSAVAAAQGQVTLNAGDNLQAIVSTSPAGATFVLNPGVYRMQSVQPRNGDSFVGMAGAVLNGAMAVSGFYFDGRVWGAYTG